MTAIELKHEIISGFATVKYWTPHGKSKQLAIQTGNDEAHGGQPFIDFLRRHNPRPMTVVRELYMDELAVIFLAENTLERVRRGEEPAQTLREIERDPGMDR